MGDDAFFCFCEEWPIGTQQSKRLYFYVHISPRELGGLQYLFILFLFSTVRSIFCAGVMLKFFPGWRNANNVRLVFIFLLILLSFVGVFWHFYICISKYIFALVLFFFAFAFFAFVLSFCSFYRCFFLSAVLFYFRGLVGVVCCPGRAPLGRSRRNAHRVESRAKPVRENDKEEGQAGRLSGERGEDRYEGGENGQLFQVLPEPRDVRRRRGGLGG